MGNLLSAISRNRLLGSFWTTDFADAIGDFFGSILWLFSDIFFIILDLFETLYRKFAGIDTNVTTSTGEKIDGDLVLYFIQSDIVQQIFMSIFVLSLFLLIIFTIFAIVKNQYAEKQEPVSKIVNSSVKALLMYLLVPIATVVCLLVGNVVLQAIDGATKTNDYAQTISDNLFSTATYNANRLRAGTVREKADQLKNMMEEDILPQHIKDLIEQECNVNLSNTDSFYMIYVATGESVVDYDKMAIIIDEAFLTGNLDGRAFGASSNKWAFATISDFYYGTKISYITIWIGGAFLIWAIGKITWGLVARLFKMTLYYAISPAVMATFPLDNGKALGSWRGEMVKNGTMALCSVGILNVLYSVLPAFNNFDLFGDTTTGGGLASSIARLFIYIIAFSSAKDLIGAISGWFGTGDALGEGIKAKGAVTSGLQQPKKLSEAMSKKAIAAGGMFMGIKGAVEKSNKIHADSGKFKKFISGVGAGISGASTGSGFREAAGLDVFSKSVKGIQDAEKKSSEYYENAHFKYGLDKAGANKFKVSGDMKKQADSINDVVDDLEAKFQAEVAANGWSTTSAEYKARKEFYDKQKIKAKADAPFLKPIYEKKDKEIELEKQMVEEHNKQFELIDTAFKAQKQDVKYKEMFEKRLRDVGALGVGATLSDDQWAQVKTGNMSVIGHYTGAQAAKELYEQVGLRIQDNDDKKEQAIKDIKEAFANGAEAYYQGVFGDTFGGDLDTTNGDAYAKYTEEKADIKQELKGLNDKIARLAEEKARKFDDRKKLSADELDKIADSLDKKG